MELGESSAVSQRGVFFFAVPEEAGPFRKAWIRAGGAPWTRTKSLSGWTADSLAVSVTGMGRRNATSTAIKVLEAWSPTWAVTAGFAGGLDPALRRGVVGYSADDDFPSRELWDRVGASPISLHEAARVAVTADAKAALRRETGAAAVEMESGTIRALCRERGVRSATVRVISDAAGDTLPLDFGTLLTPEEKLDFWRLAGTLLRSPGKIPELMRFQRQVSRAADELARVLVTWYRTGLAESTQAEQFGSTTN